VSRSIEKSWDAVGSISLQVIDNHKKGEACVLFAADFQSSAKNNINLYVHHPAESKIVPRTIILIVVSIAVNKTARSEPVGTSIHL
jgi:hypothetical protein